MTQNAITMAQAAMEARLRADMLGSKEHDMERMDWWRDSKLGMFIHWGPYTRLRGRWQGRPLGWGAEWARHSARIPSPAYHELARGWDPRRLDTGRWADLAREAGMGYVVLTTKHHDGFCLFDSAQTTFSMRHARAGRDVVAELAANCRERSLRLGCYYSPRDWDHADYLPRYEPFGRPGPRYGGWFGNQSGPITGHVVERNLHGGPESVVAGADFQDCGCFGCTSNRPFVDDPAPAGGRDLARYLAFQNAQIEELLLKYPETAILWFDGQDHTPAAAGTASLLARIRALRPDVIVNDRIGKEGFKADFGVHESYVPGSGEARDWESCLSLNDPTWGWDPEQIRWRSPGEIIRAVCDTVGRGGNLLLNVGPDDEGEIPAAAVERLRRLGAWMGRFGGSIHGTRALLDRTVPGGFLLRKGADLHVLQTTDPGADLALPGLALPEATRVELPGWPAPVPWSRRPDGATILHLASLPLAAWDGEPALALRLCDAASSAT